MPYLSACARRVWDRRAGVWVCGLDALDCPPREPAPFADCPRFSPARGVCPVCLTLGRAAQLRMDTEPDAAPHWACARCGWDGGPDALLTGLAWSCADLLDDVAFWRHRPEALARDMGPLGPGEDHVR